MIEVPEGPRESSGLDRSRAEAWLVVRTVGYWLCCVNAGLTEDPVGCERVLSGLAGG